MPPSQFLDTLLTAGALTVTIMLLGVVFLLILRTPRFQFSLRFMMLTITCIAVALGLWTAVLRSAATNGAGPRDEFLYDRMPPQDLPDWPSSPSVPDLFEQIDGLRPPEPTRPPAETTPNKE